jgi:ATP-binding cassette subfamily C (CFTR/MRP) protein 1
MMPLLEAKIYRLAEARQRLDLARVIYSPKRILLLDDVLSGLDRKTEQAVFHGVLGETSLCRTHGTTVVLATHSEKYLRLADLIVVLGRNGTIAEQGPFDELKFLNNLAVAAPGQHNASTYVQNLSAKEAPAVSRGVALQSEDATRTRLTAGLRIYAYYSRAADSILAFYLCCQATTTFLMKFPDVWLRWWCAAEVSHPVDRTGFYLGIYCMFAGLALCSMVIGILALATGVMSRGSAQLHGKLLYAVMSAPYSFLGATDSGVILNRYVSLLMNWLWI